MKFALLIILELRAIKKTIKNLYKYIIDFYDADVFILCQKQFDDDEENIKLFDRKVKFAKIYEKIDHFEYFGKESNLQNVNDSSCFWNSKNNLQVYINFIEMGKVIKDYVDDYDYFICLRSDIDIMFPFPDKELFDNIPNDIYGFYINDHEPIGGQGFANYIHKKYVLDYYFCYEDIIKNTELNNVLFNSENKKVELNKFMKKYYEYINFEKYCIENTDKYSECENYLKNNIFFHNLYQENLLIIALEMKNILIKKINNLNYYYTAEDVTSYSTSQKIKVHPKYNVLCKYIKRVDEAYENLDLWNKGARWVYEDGEISLKI
jgi:hypothetical protein